VTEPLAPAPARRSRWIGRALAGILVAAAAAGVLAIAPGATRRILDVLRDPGPAGAAILAGAYVVGAMLFLPAPPLHVLAGFAFGPAGGAVLASPASTAGACAAFALGRWLARGPATRLAARAPALAGLDDALRSNGFGVVLLLRLAPLSPFAILNFLLGATPIRLRHFALASFVGSLPGVLLDVYVGSLAASADDLLSRDLSGTGAGSLALAAVLSGAVLAGIAWLLRRTLRRRVPSAPRA
jgi:uncharacterized membrane protein YdjX (TVP38/TMEM64 family)